MGVTPLAMITGVGRSAGIGAAVAEQLAEDGWQVACTHWSAYDARMPWGVDRHGRETLRTELEATGRLVADIEVDFENLHDASKLFAEVASAAGRGVDALILCHTESVAGGLLDTTVESFDRHFAVNVRASWLLIRAFAEQFPSGSSSGRLVAMTSDHTVGNIAYGASKAALDRIVLAAAHELAPLGVRANVINPGPVDNGWMTPATKEQILAATPGGRLGTPVDAARLVRFLCSPEGEWLNAQLLRSNGGSSS